VTSVPDSRIFQFRVAELYSSGFQTYLPTHGLCIDNPTVLLINLRLSRRLCIILQFAVYSVFSVDALDFRRISASIQVSTITAALENVVAVILHYPR
jgi:hypothetical protein